VRRFRANAPMLGLLLSLSCLITPPGAAAGKDYNTQSRFPITLSVTNQCNNEMVTFTGELHVASHRQDNRDGSTTYTAHINYSNAHGIGGTTGLTYVFGSNSQSITTFPAGTSEFYRYSQRQTMRLVSEGSDPNQHITFLMEYVYDQAGFHITLYDFEVDCNPH
jgi:hypothetical protein